MSVKRHQPVEVSIGKAIEAVTTRNPVALPRCRDGVGQGAAFEAAIAAQVLNWNDTSPLKG